MKLEGSTTSGEELALARAVLYRFASDLFRDPLPEREAEWQRQSAGVLASLEVCQEAGSPQELATALEACVSCADDLERASRAELPAIACEAEWPPAGDLARFHRISDLAEVYRAFGLERIPSDQRADHLSVELGFMHLLCVREAYAEENALPDLATICRDAERRFLREHLGRWVPDFCARLERSTDRALLPRAGRFVRAWLEDELRRLGAEHEARRAAPSEPASAPAKCCGDCLRTSACTDPARSAPEIAWSASSSLRS